jgi:hypothetical protein
LSPAGNLFEDFGGWGGPDERLGIGIVMLQIGLDNGLEVSDACEDAAADAVAGDLGEEPFDHVEPGGRGRGEMQMETYGVIYSGFEQGGPVRLSQSNRAN